MQQLETCRYTDIVFPLGLYTLPQTCLLAFRDCERTLGIFPLFVTKVFKHSELMCLKQTDLASWSKQGVGTTGALCASLEGREGYGRM